jgi:monoamine oxidase
MSTHQPSFPVHPLTRRRFLKMMGAVGGAAAVFSALEVWNLPTASGQEAPPALDGNGGGVKVLVLGAGPAGLTSAYELMQRGYDVTVLEARGRVGGHVFTVRGGQVSEEKHTHPQVARFDQGQWFDGGAWRVPYIHRATLYYPKLFGIPMEVHKNANHNAWVHLEDVPGQAAGRKLRLREIQADMNGYTHELLAKAVDQHKLDLELTQEDHDAFIDYLVAQGLLSSRDLSYGPNENRGAAVLPGAGNQVGEPSVPYPFLDILRFGDKAARTAGLAMSLAPTLDQQETMMHPVGGMSSIYEQGFLPRLGDRVRFYSEVLEIHQSPDHVWATYRDNGTGRTHQLHADYMISTIPLSVLKDIPGDFSQAFRAAIEAGSNYASVGKMGLQFKRRFWEEDEWIYGGLTFTDMREIGTLAYPTYGWLSQKGVIQAYYHFGDTATQVGDLHPQDRIALALERGARIHGQPYIDEFEQGFSVSWDRVRYSNGGWSGWSREAQQQHYPTLLEPDGRIYVAGEMISHVPAWQEGAITAAWMQIEKLHARVMQS